MSRNPMLRRWSWFCIAALVVVALVRAGTSDAPPRTDEEVVRDIASSLKCPTCQGQSVAGSDAAAARAIRSDIARRVGAGESADQIRAAVAATYGDDVQLVPRRSGLEGLVWVLPVVAVVLGLAGVSAALAGWRRRGAATLVSEEDRALVERARAERGEP